MKLHERLAAIFACHLSSTDRWVLTCLTSYANDDGTRCFPGISALATNSGLTERAVSKAIARMRQAGIIRRVWDGNGKHSASSDVRWETVALFSPEPRSAPNHVQTSPEPRSAPALNHVQTSPEPRSDDPSRYPTIVPVQDPSILLCAAPTPPAVHAHPTKQQKAAPAIHRVALSAVEAIRQRPVNPDRCATDLKTITGLWTADGKPDPDEFGADLLRVIAWARESADPLAARDIRAEGWADGTDRHRDLTTICRRDRWGARVDAARSWDARGRIDIVTRPGGLGISAPSPAPSNKQAAAAADRIARSQRFAMRDLQVIDAPTHPQIEGTP